MGLMPTLTKPKKASVRKVATRRASSEKFPGLVRSPVTGLLITPLKPGQKPVTQAAIDKALADSL
jgi:hypothetical protein